MKIKKMEIGTFSLKKYLFLFFKGHLNNGLSIDQTEELLLDILCEVEEIFDKTKYNEMTGKFNRKDYPYIFNKDGEQIGSKEEEYKDDSR